MRKFSSIIGQKAIIDHMYNALRTGSVSHAYILSGDAGSGRKTLASVFAAAMQCNDLQEEEVECSPGSGSGAQDSAARGAGENDSQARGPEATSPGAPAMPPRRKLLEPCGKCLSCIQAESGNQPDIITITHAKPNSIGVDEIRSMRADLQIKPYANAHKIYIIPDAEKLTVQAQNAFLLTLEEPPPYAVILLLCRDSRALLETVRSRAPALRLDVPADGGGEDIAAEARETADRFVELAADRTGGAEAMTVLMRGCSSRDAAAAVMAEISLALRDLVAFRKCGPQKAAPLFYTDRERAADLSEKFTVSRLMGLSDLADEAKTSLARNMNTRLTLMKFLGDAKML